MSKLAVPPWLEGVAAARAGRFQTEAQLQGWMWTELRANCDLGKSGKYLHDVAREVILPDLAGRIDFVVGCPWGKWGIECKVKASQDTWKQLHRYAPHCDVLVLVTTRAHGDPPEIKDGDRVVPLIVLDLWKNL